MAINEKKLLDGIDYLLGFRSVNGFTSGDNYSSGFRDALIFIRDNIEDGFFDE